MWKEFVKNQLDTAFLHDCRIKRIVTKKNDLSLDFPEGIRLYPKTARNASDSLQQTGEARVRFTDHNVLIYVFKDVRFFGKKLFTVRKTMDLSVLMEKVSGRKWELAVYREMHEKLAERTAFFYECQIWGGGAYREAQIFIDCKDIVFSWN